MAQAAVVVAEACPLYIMSRDILTKSSVIDNLQIYTCSYMNRQVD